MAKENIAQQVTHLIAPTVEQMGYALWDVEYTKEGADYHLIVTIDKPDGITIDDCEAVHRAIDPLLDEADPIESAYYLDVSSPGVERELRSDAHILACLGQRCEAKLFAPYEGSRVYRGELAGLAEGVVTITTEKGNIALPLTAISKLKTLYFD